ncbi:hypothetical protein LCGC14_0319640 [marine sediment metagenome]|uniref:Uncharacterized protein n=1 Tax=marine sediment metagenome TaxID=412755 RepID=A0A0F9W6S0_9ZZZZ
MTTKLMTVEDAKINTTSISIRVLQIGKRQMTMSVFRQLPCEQIIDLDDDALFGVPWGLVNYFWKGCGYKEDSEHVHVVWQLGQELRRACIGSLANDPDFSGQLESLRTDQGIVSIAGIFLNVLAGKKPTSRGYGFYGIVEVEGWRERLEDHDRNLLLEFCQPHNYKKNNYKQNNAKDKIDAELMRLTSLLASDYNVCVRNNDELRRLYSDINGRIIDLQERWHHLYGTVLRDLEQLYIAV